MKLLGIDFVPLNHPLKKHLEALAASAMIFLLIGLLPTGIVLTIYLLFFTKYWLLVCVYLSWIWVVDKDTPEKGGRSSEWVRSWILFKYVKNYFPITVKAVPGFTVDSKRNYLSCSFPHGAMPTGIITAFQTNAFKESKIWFPAHSLHGLTLKSNFWIPLYREFLLAIGGKIPGLIVGGAAESFYCQPGEYRLILKDRKGFIKLALRHGTAIIPTFSFGQNNSFRQVVFAEGSFLRGLQNWVKRITRIAPIMIYGRGFFQYTFGFIPLQNSINIVVGHPIDVQKIEQPSQADIDDLHKKFIEELTKLFEEYKYVYEKDPDASKLVIS